MINIFILLVSLSIPVSLIYLNFKYPTIEGRILFSLFVILVMIERVWETFYSPKDKEVRKFHGDWTFLVTTLMYYAIGVLVIFEFFIFSSPKNLGVSISGLAIFISAGIIRFISVKTLKENWNVHLIDKAHENKPLLVKSGPYKYTRHPIYLGIILELLGIALTANALYAIILIFLINTPLYVWRSLYEEERNIIKFGDDYIAYKKEVPFIIPWKLFNTKKTK